MAQRQPLFDAAGSHRVKHIVPSREVARLLDLNGVSL